MGFETTNDQADNGYVHIAWHLGGGIVIPHRLDDCAAYFPFPQISHSLTAFPACSLYRPLGHCWHPLSSPKTLVSVVRPMLAVKRPLAHDLPLGGALT